MGRTLGCKICVERKKTTNRNIARGQENRKERNKEMQGKKERMK
jgi:hypothetical protein